MGMVGTAENTHLDHHGVLGPELAYITKVKKVPDIYEENVCGIAVHEICNWS